MKLHNQQTVNNPNTIKLNVVTHVILRVQRHAKLRSVSQSLHARIDITRVAQIGQSGGHFARRGRQRRLSGGRGRRLGVGWCGR